MILAEDATMEERVRLHRSLTQFARNVSAQDLGLESTAKVSVVIFVFVYIWRCT